MKKMKDHCIYKRDETKITLLLLYMSIVIIQNDEIFLHMDLHFYIVSVYIRQKYYVENINILGFTCPVALMFLMVFSVISVIVLLLLD